MIGPIRRKVGNVVFTRQYGKNILRTKPIVVNDTKSPGRLRHRARISKLAKLLHQANKYINTAYAGSVPDMPAFSRVMGINMNHCFIDDTAIIDASLFVLCDNKGSFVKNVVLTSTGANTITATFKSNAQNVDEGDDPVKAYGFYADGNQIWQFDQEAVRSTGTITLIKPDMSGLDIAVYFECLDRISLLNDQPKHVIKYVGTVTII